MKKITIIIFSMIAVSQIASATSVNTQYSGTGDFSVSANIESQYPSIQSSVLAHSYGSGAYEGNSYMTNDHTSLSVSYGNIDDGSMRFDQTVTEIDDSAIVTKYGAGTDGTGSIFSWVSAVPLNYYGYQNASGANSWAYFQQSGSPTYQLSMIGLSQGGDITMQARAKMIGWPSIYNSSFIIGPDSLMSIYGTTENCMGADVFLETDDVTWFSDTVVSGNGTLNISSMSDSEMKLSIDMVMG